MSAQLVKTSTSFALGTLLQVHWFALVACHYKSRGNCDSILKKYQTASDLAIINIIYLEGRVWNVCSWTGNKATEVSVMQHTIIQEHTYTLSCFHKPAPWLPTIHEIQGLKIKKIINCHRTWPAETVKKIFKKLTKQKLKSATRSMLSPFRLCHLAFLLCPHMQAKGSP